jgi:hypothetical protein
MISKENEKIKKMHLKKDRAYNWVGRADKDPQIITLFPYKQGMKMFQLLFGLQISGTIC